ncbi:MAG: organic solvent tolerance protein OstA [Alkalispirochaeta sp.]
MIIGAARTAGTVLTVVFLIAFGTRSLRADTFTFSGDRTSVVLTEGKERTVLRGNAVVISNSFELRADEIELSGTNFRHVALRGGVTIHDVERNLRIQARSVGFDRTTENVRAEGGVLVEDEENELLLKGEYLETRGGGDLIVVQTAVRVLKEDLTARAQFIRYRRIDDVVELSGFPVLFWKGDEYRATRIIMNLETEEIDMQGSVQGSVVVEDEETTDPEESSSDE